MLKRVRWFVTGAIAALSASAWAKRRMARRIGRYAPKAVADQTRHALAEGRLAMREREAELRAMAGLPKSPARRKTGR